MTATTADWWLGEVSSRRDGERVFLRHALEPAELIVTGGRLRRSSGYASASSSARRSLARAGAMLCLRAIGRYLVHASGVVDPHGRAWALAGESGAGKSTLAYALARCGWLVLGDDGVLLEATKSQVTAYAWRDPLKVSASLASQFPELKGVEPSGRHHASRQRFSVSAAFSHHASLAAIVFLEQAVTDRMTRLGPTSALTALVRQSPWVLIDDAAAPVHLRALTRVVSLVPAFSLRHSARQLNAIADTLLGTLQ